MRTRAGLAALAFAASAAAAGGPRLYQVQFPGFAVLGPLHVHRPAVVRLDGNGPAAELQDLLVRQNAPL